MSVNVTGAALARLLLPAVAVVMAYVICFAVPRHRESRQVAAASRQQLAAVEELRARVNAQQQDLAEGPATLSRSAGVANQLAMVKRVISRPRSDHSAVQAFASVLAVFREHDIQCTSALPANAEGGDVSGAAAVHHLLLAGGYRDMLAALEVIEATLPHALVAEFSMRREVPSAACRWEFAFRLCEGME